MSAAAPQLSVRLLQAEDAAAVLDFELTNRAFFAPIIGDRGEAFFRDYDQIFAGWLNENTEGRSLLYAVWNDETLVGRVNLTGLIHPEALLGYRFASASRGKGYATAAIAKALAQAHQHGIKQMRAKVAQDNPASARVLQKLGFLLTNETEQVARNEEWVTLNHYVLALN